MKGKAYRSTKVFEAHRLSAENADYVVEWLNTYLGDIWPANGTLPRPNAFTITMKESPAKDAKEIVGVMWSAGHDYQARTGEWIVRDDQNNWEVYDNFLFHEEFEEE